MELTKEGQTQITTCLKVAFEKLKFLVQVSVHTLLHFSGKLYLCTDASDKQVEAGPMQPSDVCCGAELSKVKSTLAEVIDINKEILVIVFKHVFSALRSSGRPVSVLTHRQR